MLHLYIDPFTGQKFIADGDDVKKKIECFSKILANRYNTRYNTDAFLINI